MGVIAGDISRVPADALITAINSGGMWFGGIDGVIRRAAGQLFHGQAAKAMPLTDGQTVVAKGQGSKHGGAFGNVVFVVDDLQRPLSQVILTGLTAASTNGFSSVVIPTIRMGVMLGAVEKTADAAVAQMAMGVRQFIAANPDSPVQNITFVVYNDPAVEALLTAFLQ